MATIIKEVRLIKVEQTDETNSYKYWNAQLYDDGKVKAQWGRVGAANPDDGEWDGGEKYIDKKYKEKIKKGYVEQKTIGETSSKSPVQAVKSNVELHEIAKKQIIKTSNPILERLIKRLVDSNVHKITSNTQITYNSTTGLFATPLGILSKDGLIEARDLLASISPLVKSNTLNSEFNKLVFKYLTIVPQSLGMKRILPETVIPNNDALQKQLDLIDSLEASYNALQTTKPTTSTTTPVEEVFKVDMDVLTDDTEIDRINKWFNASNRATHGYSHVKINNYYKVKIHDNWNNFNEKMGNLKEVWHGSSSANVLSILKSGLKVSPPSTAKIVGALYGRGHYGALDSSKSMQYTFGRFNGQYDNTGFLFVVDFALGKPHYISSYGGERANGYDSIWAKKENTGLRFDELIVPQDSQVRIKYLLEVR